jgi:hypothetical protein
VRSFQHKFQDVTLTYTKTIHAVANKLKQTGSYWMKKEPNKKLDKISARVEHSPQKLFRCCVQVTEGSKLSTQKEDTQFPKNVNRSFLC